MTAFLEPVLAAVTEEPTACRVFALGPDGGDDGAEFELPPGEFEAYSRFTMGQGFKLGIRLSSKAGAREVSLVSWEGASNEVRWPPASGDMLGEWIWNGYPG